MVSELLILYTLTLIHGLLQLFDWYSTSVILKRGGREQNIVMVKLFNLNKNNVDLVMGLKFVLFSLLGVFIGEAIIYCLMFLIAVYSWVAYHNWKSL